MPAPIARKIYDGEWSAAERFSRETQIPAFTPEQLGQMREWMADYARWRREHIGAHNWVGMLILISLFAADAAVLLVWPLHRPAPGAQAALAILAGTLHGWLAYSITTYSLHEGSAHQAIIFPQGRLTRALATIANHACRVFFSDPVFYRENHTLHHQKFATREDGAFSNFVFVRRIFRGFIPLAMLFNITDYKIHSSQQWTRSRIFSAFVGAAYILFYWICAGEKIGWIYSTIALGLVGPWVGFALDRIRESSEHSLMPLDRMHGTRNLGTGFWAMIIGGGPWGQPCHLSHHLGPGLTWYHQIALHRRLRGVMTSEQKSFFIVEAGPFGFPIFFARQLRSLRALEVASTAMSHLT